jgi:23S rRNA pseudouridine2605 synthase
MLERLQKTIARAGIASRRHAEQLIVSGLVEVNGRMVTELGTKADPERDVIKVAGKVLRFPGRKLHLAVHKPAGCVSAMSDPAGRKTLQDCVRGVAGRVFPIGRLEYDASGLILLTNDGEMANRLLEASRRGLEQTYWLKLAGPLGEAERRDLVARTGARLRLVRPAPKSWYEVRLTEPRRDLLRKRLLKLGHPVEKVRRVGIANLELGRLAAGEYRFLEAKEVEALKRSIEKALARTERTRGGRTRTHPGHGSGRGRSLSGRRQDAGPSAGEGPTAV